MITQEIINKAKCTLIIYYKIYYIISTSRYVLRVNL